MTSYSVMSAALMYYGLKCLLKQAYIVLPVPFSLKYTNIDNKYGRTLIRMNWNGEPPGYAENLDSWIFFKIGYISSFKWKKTYKRLFRLYIYLRTTKTLILGGKI